MKRYQPFLTKLERTLRLLRAGEIPPNAAASTVNGAAQQALEEYIPLAVRRRASSFFTPETLANQLLGGTQRSGTYTDPCCGAGNLLLPVARSLPMGSSLHETLELWGESLCGIDRHQNFVKATRLRLAILAMLRGAKPARHVPLRLDRLLRGIRVGDALRERDAYETTSNILLNPPFAQRRCPAEYKWASGNVTAAAVSTLR